MTVVIRVSAVVTVLAVWVGVGAAMARQAQAPPLPMTAAAAEKAPAIPELTALKIQNAILKLNAEQLRHRQTVDALTKIVQTEVLAFEKDYSGWTIDPNTQKVVKKPEKAEKGK